MSFRALRRLACVALAASALRADETGLDRALRALRTAPASGREKAVRAVLTLDPPRAELVRRLREPVPVEPIGAGWHLLAATDAHGVRRPFHLYVPAGLRADAPAPLLVHLHGGVSRPDFGMQPRGVGYGRLWTPLADEHGFVVAYPCARRDCMWWTDAGVAHVRAVVRETKRLVPIDDDAVFGTGFSDGASGCYHLALAAPDPFAGFLPMNGHPAVPANLSGRQLYLRNLQNVPLFVASTSDDPLYPAATVLDHLVPAMKAGAPVRLVNWERGSHTPAYFEEEGDSFVAFLQEKLRDGDAFTIDWRCADPATGRCRWVEVLAVDGGVSGGLEEQPDLNVMSTPGRVRLGVTVDRAFPGPGVRVTGVTEDSTAAGAGLRPDDVVLILDGAAIGGLRDLVAALGRARHGDAVTLTVARGDETLQLAGRFAPFESEPYYRRDEPTARVRVIREGGVVRVAARHVARLRLWLHEKIEVEGPHVVVTERALEDIVRDYARDADRGAVYTAVATVTWTGAE